MQSSAAHIDALAARLVALGANRLALSGGFASSLRPWLAPATVSHLVEPAGDALTGALALARSAARRSCGRLMSAPPKDTAMNRIVSGMQSELQEAAAVVDGRRTLWPRRSPP